MKLPRSLAECLATLASWAKKPVDDLPRTGLDRRRIAAMQGLIGVRAAEGAPSVSTTLASTATQKREVATLLTEQAEKVRAARGNEEQCKLRASAARQRECDMPRGSWPRVALLVVCSVATTALVAWVLGQLLADAVMGWLQLPVAIHIAAQLADAAHEVAEAMGLGGEATRKLVYAATGSETAWHSRELREVSHNIAMGLAAAFVSLQTLAQLGPSRSGWFSKLVLVLSDLAFVGGYYWLRAGNITVLAPVPFAIAIFEIALLLANLAAMARISREVQDQCSRLAERSRARGWARIAERALKEAQVSTQAEQQLLMDLASASDELHSRGELKAASLASYIDAEGKFALAAKVAREDKEETDRLIRMVEEEGAHGLVH